MSAGPRRLTTRYADDPIQRPQQAGNASELFEPALYGRPLDHRSITWSNIRQTDYWLHKRFQYTYPGRCATAPAPAGGAACAYGDQRLRAYAGRIVGAKGQSSSVEHS